MIYIDTLDLRTLQTESAKAVMIFGGDNDTLSKYNKVAYHNSHNWYKAILEDYIKLYGDLPSNAGPGSEIKLLKDI